MYGDGQNTEMKSLPLRERYWYEDKWVTDYMNTKTKKNTDENDFRAGSFCCTEDLRCPTDLIT